ncbi:hypothetical protein [Brevundimonas sp.]|uniref:hypothetical protein n=1 Tax=Brevundimonas sp. TaxID=1871086 RepID=UPI0025DA3D53|nr:hypothetical protein [Brevundimonas sp.]
MSEDSVISLAERRSKRPKPVGGAVVVSSDSLRIPMSKVGSYEVQWAFSATFELEGEPNVPLYGSFLEAPFEDDEPLGNAYEHEHGVNAQFVVGPGFWDTIRSVAVSSVEFEILICFYADETGAVRDLQLSINRKQSA